MIPGNIYMYTGRKGQNKLSLTVTEKPTVHVSTRKTKEMTEKNSKGAFHSTVSGLRSGLHRVFRHLK